MSRPSKHSRTYPSVTTGPTVRITADSREERHDALAVETPLQICINGKPLLVTMCSPDNTQDLVAGLLFTDGVVTEQGLREHCHILISENAHGEPLADVHIPPEYICENYVARRATASSSSCGICGRESLDDLAALDLVRSPQRPFDPTRLPQMHQQIAERQVVFGLTGGTHAAAAFDTNGHLLAVAEDVGRHNAVDKVIGLLIARNVRTSAEVLWVSGRISFEIVLKVCRAGIPVLTAVSSPTSLAIETARSVGMTLLGFCRDGRATLFCGADNILGPITESIPTGATRHD